MLRCFCRGRGAGCTFTMLTKAALMVIFALLLCSMLLASVLSMIHVEYDKFSTGEERARNHTRRLRELYGNMDDSPRHIMWFLQISDIHISIFRDHGRITQFQQFCDHTVKRIGPHVVLATGDLTDAKAKDNMGSAQVKMEWVYYHNIIKESGVTDRTIWLDIRGNHDNFNVGSLNSDENYYRSFSVQGPKNSKSYIYHNDFNGVDVAFLGIDACPEPGLRRPFNFIGILNTAQVQAIQKLQIEVASKANHTIWFGHYPTSCILWLDEESKDRTVRQMIGSTDSTMAYLCGHLHTMGGLVPHMYTMQKDQFLELELSDWKDNRVYRLGAIDHGMFTFIDQKHNSWPVVLVTNPKHAKYVLPGREPLELVKISTHIRILVFSDTDIYKVTYSIGKGPLESCENVEGPLYACRWNPDRYLHGMHILKVYVTDSEGKETQVNHPFSLDGTKINFDIYPRLFLMTDASSVFQGLFATFLAMSTLPLITLRLQKSCPRYNRRFGSNLVKRLWVLSKVDKLYYPLLLYAIYLPIGPWAVGELIDGHIGAIFAWGILIDGVFLPGAFTYMYGSIQLLFVHIPLTFVLGSSIERRMSTQRVVGINRVITHLPFIVLLTIQMVLAYFFWLAYGMMAFLFGPLRTWSILLSTILWYKSLTLSPDTCKTLEKLRLPDS